MVTTVFRSARYFIASIFRGKLSSLYSAVDNPIAVPVQMFAYDIAISNLIRPTDKVLDIGFGAGHGLIKIAKKANKITGLEVDKKALIYVQQTIKSESLDFIDLKLFNGYEIPFNDNSFDVVTCIDVIEHVRDYRKFITELVRITKRCLFFSTPNRRKEFTKPDGRPINYWHLREWSYMELNNILSTFQYFTVHWNLINGPINGPFTLSSYPTKDTIALSPVLYRGNYFQTFMSGINNGSGF
jgi:2-polyprenyl-3-methyl-5-hydroxy-6-metoxy-1,4-benzoquinol methylase